MNRKAFVVFSGYNQRGVLTFCRKLTELKIKFYIIASSADDFIFKTLYRKYVCIVRSDKKLTTNAISNLFKELREHAEEEKLVICPSSEYLNQFMLDNIDILKTAGIEIPLVSKEVYKLVTNKDSFNRLCAQKKIPIPPRYENLSKAKIPCAAKPKENICENKTLYPQLIMNVEDLDKFRENENSEHYFYEQFVQADHSYYLLYYFSPHKYSIDFSQENFLQQADGKSIVLAQPADLHNKSINHAFKNLLSGIGFHGLIMIEIKEQDNVFYMIEANPRLWGPSQLFVDNNIELLDAFIYETIYEEPYNQIKNIKIKIKPYLWFGGILSNLTAHKSLTWYTRNSLKKLRLVFNALLHDVYLRRDSFHYFWQEIKIILNPRRL